MRKKFKALLIDKYAKDNLVGIGKRIDDLDKRINMLSDSQIDFILKQENEFIKYGITYVYLTNGKLMETDYNNIVS